MLSQASSSEGAVSLDGEEIGTPREVEFVQTSATGGTMLHELPTPASGLLKIPPSTYKLGHLKTVSNHGCLFFTLHMFLPVCRSQPVICPIDDRLEAMGYDSGKDSADSDFGDPEVEQVRKFVSKWVGDYPELQVDEEHCSMNCSTCRKFSNMKEGFAGRLGSRNFKSSALVDHWSSEAHRSAKLRQLEKQGEVCPASLMQIFCRYT